MRRRVHFVRALCLRHINFAVIEQRQFERSANRQHVRFCEDQLGKDEAAAAPP
jgi:hypothetical protein